MKTIASALTLLAFVATAQANDANKTDAANTMPQSAEQATTATPVPAPTRGTVARAVITDAIDNREPVGSLTGATTNSEKLYYFTELRDMAGETVTHRWEHNGKTMAEVAFPVSGSRWRIYSSKNLLPEWTGEWRVSVVDVSGNTLHADTFMYTLAPAPSTTSSEMPKGAMPDNADMKADMAAKQ